MFLIDCIVNVFISLESLFLRLVSSLHNQLFLVGATLEEDAHLRLGQFGRGFNEFVLNIIHIKDGTDANGLQRTIHRGQQFFTLFCPAQCLPRTFVQFGILNTHRYNLYHRLQDLYFLFVVGIWMQTGDTE